MTLAPITQFRVPSRPAAASLPVAVEATSDHELMIAVRAGEIRRLGDLFERYHKPLYGFFVRLTNQPSVGEDLVQIVFYRILKYRHTYRDEGKFSAWIYHLARKVAADHFRKHASTPTPTDPVDLHAQPDATLRRIAQQQPMHGHAHQQVNDAQDQQRIAPTPAVDQPCHQRNKHRAGQTP